MDRDREFPELQHRAPNGHCDSSSQWEATLEFSGRGAASREAGGVSEGSGALKARRLGAEKVTQKRCLPSNKPA